MIATYTNPKKRLKISPGLSGLILTHDYEMPTYLISQCQISNQVVGLMSGLKLDRDSSRILVVTRKRPMTIRQLSQALGIPIAICSKKVLLMRMMGFLERKVIVEKGDHELIYYRGIQPGEKRPEQVQAFLDKTLTAANMGMK